MDLVLKKTDVSIFDFVYSDMKKQFPESELKDYDTFVNLLNGDNYELLLAKVDGSSVGYVIVATDKINKILWLDYVAILQDFHNKGYGSEILRKLKSYYNGYNGCYLEVEKPDRNFINTYRRINFYKKLGAEKLNINYYYPNKDGMIPMDLYYIPYNSFVPDRFVSISVVNNIFSILHKDIEHCSTVLAKISYS